MSDGNLPKFLHPNFQYVPHAGKKLGKKALDLLLLQIEHSIVSITKKEILTSLVK